MADSSPPPSESDADGEDGGEPDPEEPPADAGSGPDEGADVEELRRRVEAEYDFDDFGPEDMAQMSLDEWEAAFDEETWITGDSLLDRVEADLKSRVVSRDVFARVERLDSPPRVVAYSDDGYAVVYADGAVEGEGTVLRDVKPSVALCSMEEYDVPEMPEGDLLPDPVEVPEGSGELGNLMLQIAAVTQILAGLALFGAVLLGMVGDAGAIAAVAGLGFLFIGVFLFFTVANARLSDKFRAEEYRNRLRAVGLEEGERPDFLPPSATEEFDELPDEDARNDAASEDA